MYLVSEYQRVSDSDQSWSARATKKTSSNDVNLNAVSAQCGHFGQHKPRTPLLKHIHEELDQLCPSVRFLAPFGSRALVRATRQARENGTTAATELMAAGTIAETEYYRLLAEHLDVPFLEQVDLADILISSRSPLSLNNRAQVIWSRVRGKTYSVFAPGPEMVGQLSSLSGLCTSTDPVAITSPSILRAVIVREQSDHMNERAINSLAIATPASSAKFSASSWQGAATVLVVFAAVAAFLSEPSLSSLIAQVILSSFFALCVGLRLGAFWGLKKAKTKPVKNVNMSVLPVYSIMVALYDEAEVVSDLIGSLKQLNWPRSKLEIKLICEADDTATLDALNAETLDHRFEIISVPPSNPRTKPKALCYALGFTSGALVTLYDAEDRPHPNQLLEAYQTFEAAGPELACVQAPLVIENANDNFWTRMFHLEYAGLFLGLLPWLARRRAPILLGGTSNHFRRDALVDVLAWDPYNVTEDADLGLRLWRKGYRTDVINRPTFEDAPTEFKVWLPQRTRWMKGWMQTWIVHMRRPGEFIRQMSFSSFLITQALLTGTLVSALVHPLVLAHAAYLTHTIVNGTGSPLTYSLAIIDWMIIGFSYITFAMLGFRAMDTKGRREVGMHVLLVPVYWLAISVAAWRALGQLLTRPFYWEKTPHKRHERAA